MASVYKTFTSGSVLTATELQFYLMDQSIIVCDSSADYPTVPKEGMVVYDKALDSFLAYTGSAWVQFASIGAAGDSTWTPALTQSGAVTATTTTARYVRQGQIITAWCYLSVTGTGTSGNAIAVTLPVTAAGQNVGDVVGSGLIVDNGTAVYPAAVTLNTTSQVVFGGGNASGGNIGQAPSFALANTDSVRFQVQYLAA